MNARRRKIAFGIAALSALALAGVWGAARERGHPNPGRHPGRVLIIGIDGAAPERVEEWRAAGLMPNLDRLAREGASGVIRTDPVILSPRIWTSVVTGTTPAVHGIKSWVHRAGPRLGRRYRSSDRHGFALWNMFSARGRRVGVVNWLITHPPEQVNGVLISDFAIPGQRKGRLEMLDDFMGRDASLPPLPSDRAGTTWPAEWEARIEALAKAPAPLVPPPRVNAVTDHEGFGARLVAKVSEADDLAARMTLAVNQEVGPDLLMVLMQGIDRMSHFMWAGVAAPDAYPEELRRKPERRAHMRAVLRAYYSYTDALIGRLVAPFGRDDLVIVLSDHGFEARVDPNEPGLTGGHDTEAASHGVIFARGSGIEPGARIEDMNVLDVTPTVLAWAGLPVARDMQGRVASFVNTPPVTFIPAYTGDIHRLDSPAGPVEEETLEQLRALGYIR
jgi:predicted AlkP superfamily phosphohydrolase/phosphomutase